MWETVYGDEWILTLSKTLKLQGLSFLICKIKDLNSFYHYAPAGLNIL